MISQLELAFRVAVALFAMAAPTLFFVVLGRVLEFMRDDELIERVQAEASGEPSPTHSRVRGVDRVFSTDSDQGVRCRGCGATNMRDATYCQQCLRELPDE